MGRSLVPVFTYHRAALTVSPEETHGHRLSRGSAPAPQAPEPETPRLSWEGGKAEAASWPLSTFLHS